MEKPRNPAQNGDLSKITRKAFTECYFEHNLLRHLKATQFLFNILLLKKDNYTHV